MPDHRNTAPLKAMQATKAGSAATARKASSSATIPAQKTTRQSASGEAGFAITGLARTPPPQPAG